MLICPARKLLSTSAATGHLHVLLNGEASPLSGQLDFSVGWDIHYRTCDVTHNTLITLIQLITCTIRSISTANTESHIQKSEHPKNKKTNNALPVYSCHVTDREMLWQPNFRSVGVLNTKPHIHIMTLCY